VRSVPGGPLYEGDIEECHGRTRIVCPWHGYAFDVQTGLTDFGLPVSRTPTFAMDKSSGVVAGGAIAPLP